MSHHHRHTGLIIGLLALAAAAVGTGLLVRRWRRMPLASVPVDLLGVSVDPLTTEETLERVDEFIREGTPHHIFTADASGIMRAREDAELREIVRQADLVTADGAGVLLASRLKGKRLPERVSGADMLEQLCDLAARKGYRVFLLGAAAGVAQAAAAALMARHPGLAVVGMRHGFFSEADEPEIVAAIAAAHPHLLFVALGVGKQERFIRRHFAALRVPVMIGVGGSFDVAAGRLKRAPGWMQRAGLEWLYRALQEPQRLPRLAALPKFVLAVLRERNTPRA